MISVGNSTTTITTLILLLATGIVAVTAVDDCPSQNISTKNCCDLTSKSFTFARRTKESSGIYLVHIPCGSDPILADAYCDNCNGGGGWLVVQRRQDGSVDFNRTWLEYENGFGKLSGEFWYGLRTLHCLTGQGGWEMRMDSKLGDGTNIFLQYKQFKVASAKNKYKLTVGGFQGTTTDPMAFQNGMYFTTKDSDNDKHDSNCATWSNQRNGGWWYNNCWHINPNIFHNHDPEYGVYINSKWHTLPFIEMKIRPHYCNN